MSQLTGTTDTYDLVGIAEDVEDVIHDISPTETPFLTMCARGKADNIYYQWQTDALEAAGSNRQIEGDDASYATVTPTTMLANSTQISRKTLMISRTANRVRKYGRGAELAYQLVKKGKALKRDVEYALVRDQGSSAGGSGTARSSAGIEAMIPGNVIVGTGNTTATTPGFAAGAWTAPTDGTIAAAGSLLEDNLKSCLELVWQDGGESPIIMTNTFQKKKMAGFVGAAKFLGNQVDSGRTQLGVIIAGVDVYVSDFGEHRIKLNRYMKQSTVLLLDPDQLKVAWIDGYMTEDLAKTGDADKKMMICEFTLAVGNPDGLGKIYGLATS